jgi:hypothetical protein
MKAEPELFDNTMKSSPSLQLKPALPALAKLNSVPPEASSHLPPSFEDTFMSSTPFERAPPKRSKSMDDNILKSKSLLCTIPYFASKIDVDEPANAFKRMTMVNTGPQAESFECSGEDLNMVKGASGGLPGSQHAQPQFRAKKQVTSVDKLEDSSDKRGTASNALASATVKGSPPPPEAKSKVMQAHPESFDNTITWSRNMQAESSTEKTSRDGPSRRRALPKSTKSLDGNEFGCQLGHNQVLSLYMIDDSGINLGTVANAPASAKVKSSPSSASSKFTQAQPESFDNTITWSRSLQLKPTTNRTSRRRAIPKSRTRRKKVQLPAAIIECSLLT